MEINKLVKNQPFVVDQFRELIPKYESDEQRLFRTIEYFHLGVGVLFSGVFKKHKLEKLESIALSKSIESPFERLFMVFDRDKQEYHEGQEITLSNPVYASPLVDPVRNSLSREGSKFIIIEGAVKGLPLPLEVTNYEPSFLLNKGTRFKVLSKEVRNWENPSPRLSCSFQHKQLMIVHAEVTAQ